MYFDEQEIKGGEIVFFLDYISLPSRSVLPYITQCSTAPWTGCTFVHIFEFNKNLIMIPAGGKRIGKLFVL